VTVPLDLKFQEAANLSAASYVFQPRILVEDNSGAVVAEGTGNPPQPDGQYTLYSANLFFQCCPGQNSGDSDVPTTYWIVYMSADGTEGAMSYTYTTLRWAEPGGGNTGGNADGNTGGGRGGGFDCSCQDPATGRWYTTGSDLGGLNCPGIENATHVCE
jgi:hypothetical protein